MSQGTPIEGADSTWSPVTGCTDADPSCLFCYAKRLTATRLKTQDRYAGLATVGRATGRPQWSGEIRLHPELLEKPLGWSRQRIFVCSMSDLFHDDVPDDFIARVWAAMAISYQRRGHLHLCLTKRTRRARGMLTGELTDAGGEHFNAAVNRHFRAMLAEHGYSPWFADADVEWPVRGIYLGMSAGRQKEAVERWRDLSHTPIQARFMSIEPMIGPVSLHEVVNQAGARAILPDLVIAGGESGTRARCKTASPAMGQGHREAVLFDGYTFLLETVGQLETATGSLESAGIQPVRWLRPQRQYEQKRSRVRPVPRRRDHATHKQEVGRPTARRHGAQRHRRRLRVLLPALSWRYRSSRPMPAVRTARVSRLPGRIR